MTDVVSASKTQCAVLVAFPALSHKIGTYCPNHL